MFVLNSITFYESTWLFHFLGNIYSYESVSKVGVLLQRYNYVLNCHTVLFKYVGISYKRLIGLGKILKSDLI